MCIEFLSHKTFLVMKSEKSDLSEKELLEKILSKLEQQPNKKPLYSNKEMMDMLGVKDKFLKKLRDNGYIGYSRMGDKYWYTQDDLTSSYIGSIMRLLQPIPICQVRKEVDYDG